MADATGADDPYLWLEDVEGERALAWARRQNEHSLARLQADPRFEPLREQAERILTARDRIPFGKLAGGHVYNFWQDDTHVRGLWRRTTVAGYRHPDADWEILIDLDRLAESEGENWVWHGSSLLDPGSPRCLIHLSRGGTDAEVVREFDLGARDFVAGGFHLPEAKQWVAWADVDSLLVATDFGPGSLTDSGYPRQARLWRRGTDLAAAPLLLEVAREDVWVMPRTWRRPEGTTRLLLRGPDFFTQEWHHVDIDGRVAPLHLPREIELADVFHGRLLLLLRADWTAGGRTFVRGSLVAVPLAEALAGPPASVSLLAAPGKRSAILGAAAAHDTVYVQILDSVQGRAQALTPAGNGWTVRGIPLPEQGSVGLVSADSHSDRLLLNFTSYLQPDTVYRVDGAPDGADAAPEAIWLLPPRFDAAPFVTEQRFATSRDGTQVPYFVVRRRDLTPDGDNPTLLYGYGGFEVPMTPAYPGPLGMAWLQAGGVYVVANIRGGGEFGPAWHQAALKADRQRAYDDFIAVAEHLIATGITRPERLGIQGGSNGGLLVGVAMTQRPDLFGAVVCAVPLLDMLRYHKLLAGASWVGEYGNPDLPEERAWLEAYSPYQKLRPGVRYPEPFIYTSTKDDRVHPGHARKMAARMQELDHPALYYENIEGGHSAAANLRQRAFIAALQGTYLMQKLMDAPAAQAPRGL